MSKTLSNQLITKLMLGRAFLIWTLIAAAEVLHGILRVRFLNCRNSMLLLNQVVDRDLR